MPYRECPLKLEQMASKAVAAQVLKAGYKIDYLPDRLDSTQHSWEHDPRIRPSQDEELSPFHSSQASEMTKELSDFLSRMPVPLLENVVNDIEFGGDIDDDVLDRRLMTTIINLDKSRLADLSFGFHAIICALTKTRIKKLSFNGRSLLKARSFDEIGRTFLFARTLQRCLVHFNYLTSCDLSEVANDSHLVALADFCPDLEILKVNRSEITDYGIMQLAGYGKALRRELLTDDSSYRRTGCLNLLYMEAEGCHLLRPKSVCLLIKRCPKILEVRGPNIVEHLLTEFPKNIHSYGSKTLQSLGKCPSKLMPQWKSIIEAFPNIKDVLLFDDKQLDLLHEMKLTHLKITLQTPLTSSFSNFMASKSGANLTELVLRLSNDKDSDGGKPFTLRALHLAQRYCKYLKSLHLESHGKVTRQITSEKTFHEVSPQPGGLKFLELFSIQRISKAERYTSEEEKYILDTISKSESLRALKLTGNFNKFDESFLKKLCESKVFSNLTELKLNVSNVLLHKQSFGFLMKLPKIRKIWIQPARNSPEDILEMQKEVNDNRYSLEIPGLTLPFPLSWEITFDQNFYFYLA